MHILLHYPIQVLSFFSLGMALLSLWIKKTPLIFGAFGFISILTAFESGILTTIALLPLTFFIILLCGLKTSVQGFPRFLLGSTAFLIAGGLFFHFLPGFFESKALPTSLHLNYGKAFVGFLLLGWMIPTISGKDLKSTLLPAFIGALFLFALYFSLGSPVWHINFSLSFFSWIVPVLFFSILPEEALLRGFLQKELFDWIGGGLKAHISCIAITSMLYPLFHLSWAGNFSLLAPTFATGLAFASLYQFSKKVETCIVCHFLIKSCGFLFFSGYS